MAAAFDSRAAYRALASRDARFDGRIFVGVTTTGVYCRPVCPAPTPRPRNVRFFPCAAAAAEAGFRPCLRCRPETAPQSPAWRGTEATVARALRLIADGGLDRSSVGALAARLGVGERHLRRLFDAHLGASPLAVASTRRVHFAKRLLDETELPMTEVASAAGFASLRRFNAAVRDAFRATPRELRRRARARRARPAAAHTALRLRLAAAAPYDWDGIAAFLAGRAIPGVESVTVEGGERVYRRTARLDGAVGVVEVRRAPVDARGAGVVLGLPPTSGAALADAVARARRLFDLDADPGEIAATLRRDPALAPRLRGGRVPRVPGAWCGFELAVRAILGQQVSVAGARTLAGRLSQRFGTPVEDAGPGLERLFPEPAALAELPDAELASLGLPLQRARALRALAAAVAGGSLDLDAAAGVAAPERDAAIERLGALPGIGPWTAQYVAMRALRDPDALPASDLGLRRALARPGGTPLAAREVEARAAAWRPWRAYGVVALWREPPDGALNRRSRSACAPRRG